MARSAPPTHYVAGDWNAICDYCGKKFKASQLTQDWRGLMACLRDWEPRHPQDFVHGVEDNMSTPWSRPQLPPNFVLASVVNPGTGGGGTGVGGSGGGGAGGGGPIPGPQRTIAIAGLAIAGFAIAGISTVSHSAKAGVATAGNAIAGTP